MRERFCRVCGAWHNVEAWPRECYKVASVSRSSLPVPMLIKDFDEPVQSAADGKFYTSKAALAKSHKASGNPHGIDFIELGNEQPTFQDYVPDAKQRREDMKETLRDVVTGNLPPEIAAIQ